MTPNIWLLLLMFALGVALTWVARVRTVHRDVDIVAGSRSSTPPRTASSLRSAPRPPRRVEMDDDEDDVIDPAPR